MKRLTAIILVATLLMMCGCSLRTRETADETTLQTETTQAATQSETLEQKETTAEETATVTQPAEGEETTTVKEITAASKTTAKAKTTVQKKAEEKTTRGTTKQNGTTTTTKSAISSIISAVNDIISTTATTTAPAQLSPSGAKLSFSTTDINGSPVSMSTYSGSKVIIFNMWEPWCGPCVREMPDLQKLYDNYKSKGLLVVGVYSTEENAKSTVESNGITYPIIRKSSEFNAFDTGYVPTTIIVDGQGNILTGEPIIGAKSYSDWESTVAPYLK